MLKDAEHHAPDRNGRTMKLHGGVMELITSAGRRREAADRVVTKGVKLTSDDGLEVTSDQANYDERTGVMTCPAKSGSPRGG